jgi:hypothetical protein
VAWTGQRTNDWFDVVADDFDAYIDGLVIDTDWAMYQWSGASGLDPADPVRQTTEEWLDHEVPQWRTQL